MKKTTNIQIQTKNSGEGTRVDASKGTKEGIAPAIQEEATTTVAAAPKAEKTPKIMPDCKCGCGEKTKGGTFRPGHDAKYYAAQGGHTPKPTSTGHHLVDTVLGLCRKMDATQQTLLLEKFNALYATKA